ncbi:putative aldouronate transport system permease protein [Paenibacillus sp. UNCCL117]|uniref:ABC transporter permease n=1 Tax=unclassified Paenibacillus TaxID=185978 RepID=UPI00088D0163|nr:MULTISPECIES: ABC transporter permease subunit [unclassified Paenibacillus]SDE44918.1 putative aldouronate transport system permease protein [Paenibacillus sp. cl123]SFW46390.1 putative aldouronate transport system permease protein [Paenibacillus sp. UNCCL117]
MKPSIVRQLKRDHIFLLLLAPVLVYYVMFRYVPMLGIVISFMDYNLFKGLAGSEWVGLKYYKIFFQNPDAFVIIKNTLLLSAYKLLFGFPAPILLALMLNEVRNVIFKRFVQSVSYLPHFISTVVVSSMVVMLLSPSTGWISHTLQGMGFPAISFLQESEWFRTVYVTSEVWQYAGWDSILFLAALSTIDPQLYEAAKMDGAGRFRQIWHVTLPGIATTIVIVFLLKIGHVLEIGFEKVFLLANAATYDVSDVLSTYVYRVGLVQGGFSYGTAIDLSMGIIGFILVYVSNKVSRKYSETSLW